jgi:hypothetical protein
MEVMQRLEETYHKPPINLLHERDLGRIRLRLSARVVCILNSNMLEIGLFFEMLGGLVVLDDGLLF